MGDGGFIAGLDGQREFAPWGLEMVSLSRARAPRLDWGLAPTDHGALQLLGAYLSAGPPRPGGSKAEAVRDLPGPQRRCGAVP